MVHEPGSGAICGLIDRCATGENNSELPPFRNYLIMELVKDRIQTPH